MMNNNKNENLMLAKEQAFRYLAIRDHFEKELLNKLHKKGYDDFVCGEIIDFLHENGLLDDHALALRFAKEKLQKEGRYKVYQRLLQKGVEKDIASRVTEEVDVDELEVCEKVLAKKLDSMGLEGGIDKKQEAKIVNHLRNKGFTNKTIMKLVKRM